MLRRTFLFTSPDFVLKRELSERSDLQSLEFKSFRISWVLLKLFLISKPKSSGMVFEDNTLVIVFFSYY